MTYMASVLLDSKMTMSQFGAKSIVVNILCSDSCRIHICQNGYHDMSSNTCTTLPFCTHNTHLTGKGEEMNVKETEGIRGEGRREE